MKPVIEVKQGKLQGGIQKSILTGIEYYSFKGIPFAKPPVNELRFQPPVPLEKWDGILDATKDGMMCTQIDMGDQKLKGSEDCLFINVYTPKLLSESTNLKPVMVFIHGGGFVAGNGSSHDYSPDFLINYEVVFVTMNYRLHALGFLNMGTKNAVPNCGLRDQILALKWIKDNIRQFGGDPQNITIFGESAGASSVHHLTLSPLAKGLFHKAILQSATFNSSWSLTLEPEKNGYVLAKKLGYKGDEDPEKLVEFLKTQSDIKITQAVQEIHEDWRREYPGKSVSLCFLPSIEKDKQNAVLPDHPEVLMKSADPVPLIVGLNDKEGRLAFIALAGKLIEALKQDFSNCIKHDIKCDKEKLPAITNKIKQFYLGDKEVGPQTAEAITDLYSDIFFRNFYESFDNFTKSKCPVYVYEFGFLGKLNFFSKLFMSGIPYSSGAAHGDEMPYLFHKPRFQMMFQTKTFDEPELTVIKNMCSMWSNFARTGNPTQGMKPEWRPHTDEKPCYLRIEDNLKLVEGIITPERIKFWKNLRATESF